MRGVGEPRVTLAVQGDENVAVGDLLQRLPEILPAQVRVVVVALAVGEAVAQHAGERGRGCGGGVCEQTALLAQTPRVCGQPGEPVGLRWAGRELAGSPCASGQGHVDDRVGRLLYSVVGQIAAVKVAGAVAQVAELPATGYQLPVAQPDVRCVHQKPPVVDGPAGPRAALAQLAVLGADSGDGQAKRVAFQGVPAGAAFDD